MALSKENGYIKHSMPFSDAANRNALPTEMDVISSTNSLSSAHNLTISSNVN